MAVRNRLLLSGKIEVIMQKLSCSVAAVSHFHGSREILIRTSQTCPLQHVPNYLALQPVGQERAFVREGATPISIASDCREMPVSIVERRDDLGSFRHQKFLPYRTCVVLLNAVRIRPEAHGHRKIRELLVMKSAGCSQGAGCHFAADRGMLV